MNEQNKGWTPCNEKLPQKTGFRKPYWVTIRYNDPNTAPFVRKLYWIDGWCWENGQHIAKYMTVLAWQEYEIPSPYIPEGDEINA